MFSRLDASIRSELIAIEIRERQQQEEKRLRWGIAVTVLSLIAVPIGFLGAYFGVNASEVNDDWSMFDMSHHRFAYITAGCLMFIPFICFLVLNGNSWLANRREKKQREENLRAISRSQARV
jgi:formate-dependent nitrite reductase membrane component NrfD